ncbi:hypothetical protein NQ176_g9722 [Zarea fungicola]|uniref:Uncharacterized protein n=1 Tax=Zarea fungicola TaxID=93591 RepID=A0ACC1ML77_9HYPO|nr:hypothetical protein NQ176_g9722 [Lecanicillium fungicola]
MRGILSLLLWIASCTALPVNSTADDFASLAFHQRQVPVVENYFVQLNGTKLFYRQAGPRDIQAKTILLLHGFPSSSHQFRNLMPLLAAKGYRVLAPDYPGYGFTVPAPNYVYNFANTADIVDAFTVALGLDKFAIYVHDYGAPTGLRLALKQPDKIVGIVSQNGNAYNEGFGAAFWAPIRKYWSTGAQIDRDNLRGALELNITKWQYINGASKPDKIGPEAYYLDQTLMDRPGNKEIQLDMFYDYRTNLPLYADFQKYFRTSNVPVLAVWGKNDEIFVPAGAEAFKRDVKRLELALINEGHFAIETNEYEFAERMDAFFHKFNVFKRC